MFRHLALLTSVTAFTIYAPVALAASCGVEPVRRSIPRENVVAVFSGTVVGIESSGFRPFDLSRRYVVVAYSITEEERALFKVDGKGNHLSVSPCGGMLLDEAQAIGDLDRVGPGRAPQ